jgi:hypothetical protein
VGGSIRAEQLHDRTDAEYAGDSGVHMMYRRHEVVVGVLNYATRLVWSRNEPTRTRVEGSLRVALARQATITPLRDPLILPAL